MIKLGKASLRGEIIRPVCKCKLLRNFLPSPTLSCTILLANLSRADECGKVKRECETREIFTWEPCKNLMLCVIRMTRGRKDRSGKREREQSNKMHGPTRSDVRLSGDTGERKRERKRKREREREAGNAHNHREWQISQMSLSIQPFGHREYAKQRM